MGMAHALKCFSLARALSIKMKTAMTYNAASHQEATGMIWLIFGELSYHPFQNVSMVLLV